MSRQQLMRAALIVFGVTCCLLYPLSIVWPTGWAWHAGPPMASHYFTMIVAVYATLGLFLIRASRNPAAHRSLIEFAIWSSVVHAVVMAVQAMNDPMQSGHLVGDVPALLLVAIVLGALLYGDRSSSAA
jgi:hypothetical protein